jgi:hypothetical protein
MVQWHIQISVEREETTRLELYKLQPKRNNIRELKKLHNEELHNLYSSSYFIRVIKFMRMRCMEHVWER